ncbi:MAG: transposase, partial [Thermoprotei archaeon]
MLKRAERVRMYSISLEDARVRELISWYIRTLQKAIDTIWDNITWKYDIKNYKRRRHAKVKVPVIPKSSKFKRELRNELMKDNPYARHWVDAVIRTAYSIMDSWRKRYVKGKAKKCKPRIRRR